MCLGNGANPSARPKRRGRRSCCQRVPRKKPALGLDPRAGTGFRKRTCATRFHLNRSALWSAEAPAKAGLHTATRYRSLQRSETTELHGGGCLAFGGLASWNQPLGLGGINFWDSTARV